MNWILSMNEFFTNKGAYIYTRNVTHKLYKLTYFTGLIKAEEDFECLKQFLQKNNYSFSAMDNFSLQKS